MSSNARVLPQDAELHLRGGVRARVTWPPATAADRPPLLVFVPGRGEHADADLCRELAFVLLERARQIDRAERRMQRRHRWLPRLRLAA